MKAFKLLSALALSAAISASTYADNFSFTGNLSGDDDVQLFNFYVGATSNVTLRTWSYAGGINAAGASIDRGGFDPILALFDSSGLLIDQNDDGSGVATDLSGAAFDTLLQVVLGPGIYTVSVAQYSNFAIGPNLSDGFDGSGVSGFVDVSGHPDYSQRDSHWAFDILNVNSANSVPEAGSTLLLAVGAMSLMLAIKRRRA